MRGKGTVTGVVGFANGITPAYAGKRLPLPDIAAQTQDHPRVCGEKQTPRSTGSVKRGSPPRMRGKVDDIETGDLIHGITPAYAGKRLRIYWRHRGLWDHPRVCGEKALSRTFPQNLQGSPPRMRGKVRVPRCTASRIRITPAYAGKSPSIRWRQPCAGDHPRVCGEKPESAFCRSRFRGSPPRMRGKALYVDGQRLCQGITPAYAGKSMYI